MYIDSVYIILTEKFEWSKLSARQVCKPSCPDQLQTIVDLSMEILQKQNKDPETFLQRIGTIDKPKIYHHNPENKIKATATQKWKGFSGNKGMPIAQE